ncbi:MAG: CvpA family protein [Acidobacteria bacterium]|nr:MAG: CvpA family protein [Acidobacteriota bacterium]
MTALDYVVIGVTGLSTLYGLARGLVRSVVALLVAVAGLLLAASGYPQVVPLIRPWVASTAMARLLAFLLIFALVIVGGMMLSRALRRALERADLSWIDHLAGGAFGFIRGWFICSVLYLGLTAFPISSSAVGGARLAPYLVKGADLLTHALSNELRGRFLEGYDRLQALWEHQPAGVNHDQGKDGIAH